MTIGSLGYVVNDGFVRRITENGPNVYQVLFLRSLGLAVLFAALGRAAGDHAKRTHLRRPFLLRIAAETAAAALFFAAVVRLEFANAQAILQVTPFAVMLAASFVLKERVQIRQYIAILVGFAGVVIVVRPATEGFSMWSLAVVASAGFMVIRELATRNVHEDTPAFSIAFATAIGLAGLTGVLSLFSGWSSFSAQSALLLFLSICSLSVGYVFTIQTVRIGDLSVSAPFRYTVLIGAVVIGYLLFDEVPDRLTVIGSLIIIVTGIYAVQLEKATRF